MRFIQLGMWACLAVCIACGSDEIREVFPGDGDAGDPIFGDGDAPDDGDPAPFDAGSEDDAGPAAPDDAGGRDASGPLPEGDAGPMPDVVLGNDCVEEFLFDPAGRDDVTSVVVASAELSGWDPARSPSMRRDEDGIYRLTVGMFVSTMAYKFVVNGSEWLPDPAACHGQSDGNGGQNSIRYACQEAPACPTPDACPAPASTDLGDGCPQTFVFDPHGREDVERVVLVGGAPLSWEYASCDAIPLSRGDDGLWRVSVELPLTDAPIPYKFVVNDNAEGAGWTADLDNCHELDGNSLLYCQDAPTCPGSGRDAGVDAGGADAGGVDAGAEPQDAGEADAGRADAGEADAGGHDAAVAACDCVRTVWVDLNGKAGVTLSDLEGVYLFGDHPDFGDWRTAAGNGQLSAVRLEHAGEGLYFVRVAPPAEHVAYKLFVRHRDGTAHPPVYLNDEGNCQPRQDGNDVMHACGLEPAQCDPVAAPVALPEGDVSLCTRCDVSVRIPAASLPAVERVALRGEKAPLSWSADSQLTLEGDFYVATLNLPRGQWEYLLRLNDDDARWQTDPSNACYATQNNLLHACVPAPTCE